jgi:Mor family transcriptional regulator
MAFFDPNDVDALTTDNLEVDQIFDLSGLGAVEALAIVEAAMIDKRAKDEVRLWFKFAHAVPGGGETLFQPVGKGLRDAIKAGRAVRAMPAKDGGWIVRLAALTA